MTINLALPRAHSSRFTLPLLAAVFGLPFLLGSGLFWLDWRPAKFSHHGELLQPPRTLPETGLQRIDGRPLPTAALHGKWLLVSSVGETCGEACQATLQQLGQLQLALNKEHDRVQRVLIVRGAAPDASPLTQLQQRFPGLLVATVPAASAAPPWADALDDRGQPIYLVDPLANVMMRYAGPVEMRGVLKDLERLLKYSWIR